jgi:hypothetical protein
LAGSIGTTHWAGCVEGGEWEEEEEEEEEKEEMMLLILMLMSMKKQLEVVRSLLFIFLLS